MATAVGDAQRRRSLPSPRTSAASEDRDGELFNAIYPALRRFAAASAPPAVEPDDLVQQAVANTLAKTKLVDLDHPATYLRTAILNLAKNEYRRRARPHAVQPAHTTDSYPSDLAALMELTPTDRAALYLVDVERLSYRDAANLIGCSAVALRARSSRARKRLQQAYENGVDV